MGALILKVKIIDSFFLKCIRQEIKFISEILHIIKSNQIIIIKLLLKTFPSDEHQ